MRKRETISYEAIKKFYGDKTIGVTNNNLGRGHVVLTGEGFPVRDNYSIRTVAIHGPVSWVEMTELRTASYSRFMPVLADDIKVEEFPNAIDQFEAVLNKYYSGYFSIDKGLGYIYIHYPELTITNTYGVQHKIYDMVVQIKVRDVVYGTLDNALSGMRFSYTKDEVSKGYIHSHLHPYEYTMTNRFCLGGGSKFSQLLHELSTNEVSEDRFEIFLLQLKEYLCWESIEGTPYINMTTISGVGTEEGWGGEIGEEDEDERIEFDYQVSRTVLEFLKKNPQFIIFKNGIPTFDPSVDDETFFTLEKELAKRFSYASLNWSNELNCYVYEEDSESVSSNRLPAGVMEWYESRLIKVLPNLKPRIVEQEAKKAEVELVPRLSRNAITYLVTSVNDWILKGFSKDAENTYTRKERSGSGHREASRANSLPA